MPPLPTDAPALTSPVRADGPPDAKPLHPGSALCLSGGGYRAMLFHAGVLWRLHESGQLARLERISSVSGGSITAGALALALRAAGSGPITDFARAVVEPIRRLARRSIDVPSILTGLLLPGGVGDRVAAAYDAEVFHGATLDQLPDRPRFVFNATNVQSGALWRFSKPYMRDWKVGKIDNPKLRLAKAVAASSAFPPVLSPLVLELDASDYDPGVKPIAGFEDPAYRTRVLLTDGGVYDNLGLETAWKVYKTILVSDGGGQLTAETSPQRNWAGHAYRVLGLVDSQVRALRKRQVVGSLVDGTRSGAYWGIRSDIGQFPVAGGALPCDPVRTLRLAQVSTRLKALDDDVQERLINWGYAICDAALRAHVDKSLAAPAGFPYPRGV